MKKRVLSIVLACALMLSLPACGKKDGGQIELETNPVSVIETPEGDYMEKYIASLDEETRSRFTLFWSSICSYCRNIEAELKEMENVNEYSFDPTKSDTIPPELAEKYNFSNIKFYDGYDKHENYEMKVVGDKVQLSFDGEIFYPTEYSYSDIEDYVEKYTKE